MKKIALFSLLFFSINSIKSQDTLKIIENSDIIKISDAELIKSKENVQEFVKGIESSKLYFDRFVIIGPKLWSKLKNILEFSKIKEGNVTFKVPKFEKNNTWKITENVEGKAVQSLTDYINLWNYLDTNYSLSKALLSKLNTTDKFIYWQYFAKLEQGTNAVEINSTRFILQFAKNKIFFIEMTNE
jgi:hypothetical protein